MIAQDIVYEFCLKTEATNRGDKSMNITSSNETKDWREYFNMANNAKKEDFFIDIVKKFDVEYKEYKQFFSDINENELKRVLASTAEDLINLNPDNIRLELTEDKTLSYVFTKDNKTVYYEYYLNFAKQNFDETVLVIIDKKNKNLGYGGSHNDSIDYLNNILPLEDNIWTTQTNDVS